MPSAQIQETVTDFLTSKESEVLVLQGEWGTGKTFFWNNLVIKHSRLTSFCRKRYAYVSLFGINSLDDLKDTIVASTTPYHLIGTTISLRSLFRRTGIFYAKRESRDHKQTFLRKLDTLAWSKVRKLASLDAKLSYLKGWSGITRAASHFLIKDMLICIDDLERMGASLGARDVIGYISTLKEQRNCKIAIILNMKALEPKVRDEYSIYREKVFDAELNFTQTTTECLTCLNIDQLEYYSALEGYSEKLNIRNIRVLQRIIRRIEKLRPLLEPYSKPTRDRVIHSLVLFCWCHETDDESAPSLDYLRDIGFNTLSRSINENLPNSEKQHIQRMSSYGYTSTDNTDIQLIDYVKNGFINKEAFVSSLLVTDSEVRTASGERDYTAVWEIIHSGFADDKEEFVTQLLSIYRRNLPYSGRFDQLHGTCSILRKLGYVNEAEAIVDEYIEQYGNHPKIFDLNKFGFRELITDQYMIQKFGEKVSTWTDTSTFEEVMVILLDRNSWQPEQLKILASASIDQYYEFFVNFKAKNAQDIAKACIDLMTYKDTFEDAETIAVLAREALLRIARESKYNSIRVNWILNEEDMKTVDEDEATETSPE